MFILEKSLIKNKNVDKNTNLQKGSVVIYNNEIKLKYFIIFNNDNTK